LGGNELIKKLLLVLLAIGGLFWYGCELPYDTRESEPILGPENVLYQVSSTHQSLWDWQVSPDDKKLAYLETTPSFFLCWYDLNTFEQKIFGPVQFNSEDFDIRSITWDESHKRAIILNSGKVWIYDTTSHQLWPTQIDFSANLDFKTQNVQWNNNLYHLIGYHSYKFILFNYQTFQTTEIDFQPDTLEPHQYNLRYFVKQNSDTVYALVQNYIVRFSLSSVPQHLEILVREDEITSNIIGDIFQVDENYFGCTSYNDSLFFFKFNQSPPLLILASYSFPRAHYIATVDKRNILFQNDRNDRLVSFDLITGNAVTLNYTNSFKNIIPTFDVSHFIPENRSLFCFAPMYEQSYLNILNLENKEKIISDKFLQGNPKALCWQSNEKLLEINTRRSGEWGYNFIQTYSWNGSIIDSIGVLPTTIFPGHVQLFSNGILIQGSNQISLYDLTGHLLESFAYNCGTFDLFTQSYLFLRYPESYKIELGTYRPGDSLRTHKYPITERVNITGFSVIPPNSPLRTQYGYCYSILINKEYGNEMKLTNAEFSQFQRILDLNGDGSDVKFQWDPPGENLYYGDKWQIVKLKIWYEF